MARFITSDPVIYVNGARIGGQSFTVTIDKDFHFAVKGEPKPLRPGDEGYDPDYDPELDKLGWDADDFSPHACAPEVAASPYKASDRSPEAQRWRANAIGRESDRRYMAGKYGAFTDEEMDEARALVRAEVKPDPVKEILGYAGDSDGTEPETPEVVGILGYYYTHSFTVDVSALMPSLRDAAAQTVWSDTSWTKSLISFEPSPAPLKDVSTKPRALNDKWGAVASYVMLDEPAQTPVLQGFTIDTPKPTLNHVRHGAAATCPRHGETRGGTCMKCARGR